MYCSGFHRFDRSILLDLDPRKAVLNIVKSKLLEYLDHDLPYALKPQLEHWEVRFLKYKFEYLYVSQKKIYKLEMALCLTSRGVRPLVKLKKP